MAVLLPKLLATRLALASPPEHCLLVSAMLRRHWGLEGFVDGGAVVWHVRERRTLGWSTTEATQCQSRCDHALHALLTEGQNGCLCSGGRDSGSRDVDGRRAVGSGCTGGGVSVRCSSTLGAVATIGAETGEGDAAGACSCGCMYGGIGLGDCVDCGVGGPMGGCCRVTGVTGGPCSVELTTIGERGWYGGCCCI